MDEKFYVPFKTAKLLKEKGYNGNNDYVYDCGGVKDGKDCIDIQRVDFDYLYNDTNSDIDADEFTSNICIAPTYHEVLDWLEGRKVRIYAEYCNGWWYGFIDNSEAMEVETTVRYQTREEALNDGILKALEKL